MAANISIYDKALYNTAMYRSWRSMKSRCNNPKVPEYGNYGGRGITVCEKWRTFAGFLEDMSSTHQEGLSLDRIDNEKGYSKENCRWATRTQQSNNRRTNRQLTLNGITKTLTQWIVESGQKPSTVRQRYYGYKWPLQKALGMEV